MQVSMCNSKPIRVRVDREFATEMVNSGLTPSRVKLKTRKIRTVITQLCNCQLEGQCEASKMRGKLIGRW